MSWDFCFWRYLTDREIFDFTSMLGMVDKIFLSVGRGDKRVWKPDVKGNFSVKSFFDSLTENPDRAVGWYSFWDPLVPPRVLAFCWIARWHKILTIGKLRQRNHVIVNEYPMCLKDEELVHHLTIHCPFAYRVWIAILDMFGMQWVMPRAVDDLFLQWRFGCKYICSRILRKLVLYATL